MRKVNLIVLAVVAIHLLAAPLTFGQGGNPPASTKESGATSGHGMTAVEQAGQNAAARRYINLPNRPVQAHVQRWRAHRRHPLCSWANRH